MCLSIKSNSVCMSGRNISDSLLLLKYPISSCLLQGAIALQYPMHTEAEAMQHRDNTWKIFMTSKTNNVMIPD